MNSCSVTISKWDASEYLDSDEAIAAFLADALESGDRDVIVLALNTVARARGMTQIAKDAGIARQALYKSLGEKGNPTLSTLLGVMKSLGLKFSVTA
ncbi:MAG: putative addiction module antidote protein [Sphingopyxis sp.]|nr:putative addiction module antidote protein [Sphingopyxis sp.]